ncbi:MAG TPA: phosphate/phosphite/phosphonate ABC transporter substrate-binding protein [Burkholderiales bacterium]|nr:phosphate/phosphite/phosphonate ABC transporter substrate-binding protein [Burkholderiales bacterium]
MSLRRFSLLLLLALAAGAVQAAADPLTMGVFPRRNSAETARQFAPMAAYLGERLGRKVTLATSKNFEAFWEAVREKRYDIVHYNQYHYIRSAQSYQVIAHIEEFGKSTICGAIYVRKDSGITDLAQLRGRTVMFGGGEEAMISYIANRYLLERAGLRNGDFKALFAVNPPNAILALDHRQSDAAGAGDSVLELPEVKAAMNTDEVAVLAVSPPLLQLPVAVRRDMPAALRESIQSLLVNIGNDEAGRQVLKAASMTGMGKAEDRDYDPHRKLAAAVFGAESFPGRGVRGTP